jgi:hypothetical protein
VADKFRVGIKVRLLPCVNPFMNEELTGNETTIIALWEEERIWEIDIIAPNGCAYRYHEDHMEPVYDGDEKSSWSECAWKPQTEPKQKRSRKQMNKTTV